MRPGGYGGSAKVRFQNRFGVDWGAAQDKTPRREYGATKLRDMSAKQPTVSVVVPTYNRAHLVGRAIRSALNQTYRDLEVIVIDDASTDHTEETVRRLKDSRITYVRHAQNQGGAIARNRGLDLSSGEYVAFLDDDDMWEESKLERQIALLEKSPPGTGVVYCGLVWVSDWAAGRVTRRFHPRYRGWLTVNERFAWVAQSSTMLVSREQLLQIGGLDPDLRRFQDPDLVIRLAGVCAFEFVNDVLVFCGEHCAPQPEIVLKASASFLSKHQEVVTRLSRRTRREVLAHYGHYAPGMSLLHHGRMLGGVRQLLFAIGTSPWQLGYYPALLASLTGRRGLRIARRVRDWLAARTLTKDERGRNAELSLRIRLTYLSVREPEER